MADTKTTDRKTAADLKRATALDKISSKILASIDPSYTDQKFMSDQDAQFQKIIDRQLDIAKGVANNQIVDFIASLRANQNRNGAGRPKNISSVDTYDLFTDNIGDIFGYFQDVYKNRYMEVSDLKFISKFIPSIGESVRIYLDAIVASDDVSQTITRNILLPNISDNDKKEVMSFIENMEEQLHILSKLKVAYKKTLVSGSFYVYHIAYRDLFTQYSQGLASGHIVKDGSRRMGGPGNARAGTSVPGESTPPAPEGRMPKPGKHNPLGVAQESAIQVFDIKTEPALEAFGEEVQYLARDGLVYKCSYNTTAMESAKELIQGIVDDAHLPYTKEGKQYEAKDFGARLIQSIESDLPNIYFINSDIPYDIINATSGVVEAGMESSYATVFGGKGDNSFKSVEDTLNAINHNAIDGTMDINGGGTKRAQKFDGISGTYLKWIDYKYMMPIDVLGQRIGYYHIITTPKSKKAGKTGKNTKGNEIGGILSSGSMSLFDQLDVSEKRKEAAIQNIVDTISEAILDQFGASFVKKNAAFRELIAECIIANGLVNNDYMIQFIPANQVIEFKCNEDENGKGESILSEALFPAHLLLSIVVSKMLNYINKGGNRTIAHISSGRVNRQLSNQVNRVIRDLQSGNVTFTDLLSSSMVFSKVTRDSNIAMPKDQAGNRLVEFEVQEGQQIDLNTEYESMLEKWCMIATGMPPTVMDYESSVDVAKKVVSDNIHVAGRVASLQSDFEGPTTQLYRALIDDSDMEDTIKAQISNTLKFKLPRPRILANQNNSEALSTSYQNGQTIANIMLGEDSNDPKDMRIKNRVVQKFVQRETPFIKWDEIEEDVKQARSEITAEDTKKAADNAGNKSEGMTNPEDDLSNLGGF